MTAPTLFDVDGPGSTHRDDPATSVAAAAGGPRMASQRQAVLAALIAVGAHGATPHELWPQTPCAYPHVVATRLADLAKKGLAVVTDETRPTPSGHRAMVWRATEAGS